MYIEPDGENRGGGLKTTARHHIGELEDNLDEEGEGWGNWGQRGVKNC